MEMDATAIPTQPAQGDDNAPQLGFFGKLWNLFVDPKKTFASVGRNHEWIVLWVLVSLVAIGGQMSVKEIVSQERRAHLEEQLDQRGLAGEEREQARSQAIAWMESPWTMLGIPVGFLLALLIVAGILLFIGNIILGGDASFLKMLNAWAWTALLVIPESIVTIPMVMAKESMDVSIGLGVMTSSGTGAFLKSLLSSFELFGLWQVWLSSVAVSVLAKVDAAKALWAVFSIWLIWVLAKSGLATLGIQFGM